MKLSNIILTLFSILFLVYLFGIAAEIRYRGNERELTVANSIPKFEGCNPSHTSKTGLPNFKVLKIRKFNKIGHIILGQNTGNVFTVFAENGMGSPNYHKSGDTLFIDGLNGSGLCNKFQLELSKSNVEIIIDSMQVDFVSNLAEMELLDIKGSNATLSFSGIPAGSKFLDSLHINLTDNSSLFWPSKISINQIDGEISQNSRLELLNSQVKSGEIQIGGASSILVEGKRYFNPDSSAQLIYYKENSSDTEKTQE